MKYLPWIYIEQILLLQISNRDTNKAYLWAGEKADI